MSNDKKPNNVGDYQTVVFYPKAHEELLKGASVLANAVASTMGPAGHSVIIDMEVGPPIITKDGVTVAKSINLKNRLQAMGAELIKEVASKTNELCGDGTSTSTVLAHAILVEGIKMISTGHSSIQVKKGMELAVEEVVTFLKKNCVKISSKEEIVNVGTISANGDKFIGKLISDAIEKVGADGIITIEPAKSIETSLTIVEGMQLDTGYISPFFITNSEKASCELQDCRVLLTPNKISSIQDIIKILETCVKNSQALLIIADDVEGDALHTLIVNKTKGILKVCAVKAPSYSEHRADILSDLQTVVNGTIFGSSTDKAVKNATVEDLGVAKKVIITRNNTTIIGNSTDQQKEKISQRVNDLRNLLTNDKSLDALHLDKYRKRLARLSGGIAVIKVGGSTEVEILEKKDRVEDAVNATMAAVQEGIVPGCGMALFYAAQHLKSLINLGKYKNQPQDIVSGIEMISNVCEYPFKTIVQNSGISAEVVADKIKQYTTGQFKVFYIDLESATPEEVANYLEEQKTKSKNKSDSLTYGYNVATGQYVDLLKFGVIDPVLVSRHAISNASSVIGLLLSANAVIVNEE